MRGELVAGDGGVDLRLKGTGIDFAAIRYLDRWPYLAGHGDIDFRLQTPAPVRVAVKGIAAPAMASPLATGVVGSAVAEGG